MRQSGITNHLRYNSDRRCRNANLYREKLDHERLNTTTSIGNLVKVAHHTAGIEGWLQVPAGDFNHDRFLFPNPVDLLLFPDQGGPTFW